MMNSSILLHEKMDFIKQQVFNWAIWIIFGTIPDWNNGREVQNFCRRNIKTLQALAVFTPWQLDDAILVVMYQIVDNELLFKLWWGDLNAQLTLDTNNSGKKGSDDNDTNVVNRPILNAVRTTLINLRTRANRN